MDNQTEQIKTYIASNIFQHFESVFNDFSSDDYETAMIKKIVSLPPQSIAQTLKISENMAQKYKSGKSLPSLEGAVVLEETFAIPAKFWVKYKQLKQIEKA